MTIPFPSDPCSTIFLPLMLGLYLDLTEDDIRDIDIAGAIGSRRLAMKTFLRRGVVVGLVGAALLGTSSYM